jgi:ribosomal protein S18 acetylase RimI-like enzyme
LRYDVRHRYREIAVPVDYYKRQLLCRDLSLDGSVPALLPGYRWLAGCDDRVDAYADVLARAFAGETDSRLFPSLSCTTGCRMLVRAIRDMAGFCPDATWLIEGPEGPVAAVLGSIEFDVGTIQNIGVVPAERDRGLGAALLVRSLAGFAAVGARRVELEVTVSNSSAMALYRRFGFRAYKSSYRSVEVPDRSMVGLGI